MLNTQLDATLAHWEEPKSPRAPAVLNTGPLSLGEHEGDGGQPHFLPWEIPLFCHLQLCLHGWTQWDASRSKDAAVLWAQKWAGGEQGMLKAEHSLLSALSAAWL